MRLGGYDLARDDAELARLARAVAPSGRTTAGMAYSVTRSVDLLMTRGHRGPTVDSRRAHEIAVAEARRLRGEAAVLREAARTASAIRARIARRPRRRRAAAGASSTASTDGGARLQTERADIEKRDTAGLAAEIAALTAERIGYLRELSEELEPKLDRLLADEAALRARLVTMREAARAALSGRRAALRQAHEWRCRPGPPRALGAVPPDA